MKKPEEDDDIQEPTRMSKDTYQELKKMTKREVSFKVPDGKKRKPTR